ncbi:MAG: hypothetical protein GX915_01375 [Clostridiales bacterium]|nr:hypothetical protein [Clostridiales bacterium]
MKPRDLIGMKEFSVLCEGNNLDREISIPYCCDLLSLAMANMPAGAAWVTVMANVNTLAVATLTDAACIILAGGTTLDELGLSKVAEQGITVFRTELPIFEAALLIYNKLNG